MLGFIYAAAEAGDEVTHDDALRLALITAPYLYLFPSRFLYK